jgi:hypothetical protein
LKYATDKWSLGALGKRTAHAQTFAESLLKRAFARDDCPKEISVPSATDHPLDVPLNGQQAALAGFSHHLEVNVTKADDATIAEHSKAMAGSYIEQSSAVAARADHFLSGWPLAGGSGGPA